MSNKEPTQEELQKFWDYFCPVKGIWRVLTLDNLFKYAVPKLDKCQLTLIVAPSGDTWWNADIQVEGSSNVLVTREKPEIALFRAIQEAIK